MHIKEVNPISWGLIVLLCFEFGQRLCAPNVIVCTDTRTGVVQAMFFRIKQYSISFLFLIFSILWHSIYIFRIQVRKFIYCCLSCHLIPNRFSCHQHFDVYIIYNVHGTYYIQYAQNESQTKGIFLAENIRRKIR